MTRTPLTYYGGKQRLAAHAAFVSRYDVTLACGHKQTVWGERIDTCHCWTCRKRVAVLGQERHAD